MSISSTIISKTKTYRMSSSTDGGKKSEISRKVVSTMIKLDFDYRDNHAPQEMRTARNNLPQNIKTVYLLKEPENNYTYNSKDPKERFTSFDIVCIVPKIVLTEGSQFIRLFDTQFIGLIGLIRLKH